MELRPRLEIFRKGFLPKPFYTENLLSSKAYEDRVDAATLVFRDIAHKYTTWTMLNPFNNWVDITRKDCEQSIANFINRYRDKQMKEGVASALTSLNLYLFAPLPLFSNHRLVYKLSAVEEEHLGDGCAFFDENTRLWGVTQRHGIRLYPAHLITIGSN